MWKVAFAAAILIGISTLAIVTRKRIPYLLVGWFWFLGVLVPMIGIVQVGLQARADRYMYIPMIGILLLSIWGVADLCKRFRVSQSLSVSVFVLILAALSAITFRQVGFWRNSETLWNYTLSVTHDNFMAEDNLAQELATQGRTEEALVHFHHILNLHDWNASDLIAFGAYEQNHGYAADAIKQYQRAAQNASDATTRAIAFSNVGSAYLDLRNVDQAEINFERALQFDPDNLPALIGTGLIAQKKGSLETAIRQYTKAVSIKPTDLGYELLGRAYEQSGRSAESNAAYAQAQRLSPNLDATRSLASHLLGQ